MSAKISVLLSDFIRAESGDMSAVFETRVQVAQSAVFHLLQSNNKTQWNMVTAACKLYANPKECAAALAVDGKTPSTAAAAVKRMNAVYLAYGAAIDSLALPAFVKGRPVAEIEAIASDAALQVATLVTGALTVAPKQPATEAEKEAKAKAKADKEAKAKAELEQTIRTEAEKLASVMDVGATLSLSDMVTIVANAVRSGMVAPDSLSELDSALDTVAANVVMVPVAAPESAAHA